MTFKKVCIQNMRDAELANAHIYASHRTANSSTNAHICESRTVRVKKDDLTRSRSLNRLGLPEARENTLLCLTSVLFIKFILISLHAL